MKHLTKCSSLLILFLYSLTTTAQQTTIDLDPISITSSLQPKNVSKTGRNITIINGEEFSKLPVHSIDELLRYVPGVEVQSRGPRGAQSDIVIRGGTFQQVLVILDGLRLNDPITGHFNSYIPIAPTEIDRIEILKGASSAIYGSEAVGGVIHIISKTFVAKQNEKRKQLSVQGTAGEYDLKSLQAGGLYQTNKTSISLGLLINDANGQMQRGTRGYFHNNTFSISAGHYLNNHLHLSFRSSKDKRDFSAQNFYTTFKSDTASEIVESQWSQLSLAYHQGKRKIVVDAGYKNVSDEFSFNKGFAPNKNKSTLFQASSRIEYNFTATTSLVTGIQFQNKEIKSNDRGDHQLKQVAGFLVVNKSIGDFIMVPAIRLDYTENSGSELIPQINISYRKKNIQLRGSAGKTIRQADFTERYNNYNKSFVASGSIGNPNLEAETSFSYEAGVDFFIKNNLKISSGVFRREQEKLIDYILTPYSQMPRKTNLSPTGTYALAKNIAEVNTTGFETDIQYSRQLTKSQLIQLSTGIVWLDSETSEAMPSFYLTSHAKFLANFSTAYSNKYFRLSANGLYKKRKEQEALAINARISKDYFLMNLKGEVFLLQDKASLFAQLDNVFGRKYSDLLGAQMPNRWLSAGFKINLN